MNSDRLRRLSLRSLVVAAIVGLPAAAGDTFTDHFANRDDIGQYKVPRKGQSRILVVPVQINSVDGEQRPPVDLAGIKAFFETPPTPGGGAGFTHQQ